MDIESQDLDGRKSALSFVIWAPSYDEKNGGTIALHTLCDRLTKAGVDARIWSNRKPSPKEMKRPSGLIKLMLQLAKEAVRPYSTGPFTPRFAEPSDLQNAIAVYPEIVSGNPWGANGVVRWLLYMPGFHGRNISFGAEDLYFFYHNKFNIAEINAPAENLLRVSTVHPAYSQTNFGDRSGAAYMVRKGKGKILDKHPVGAIRVDGRSHKKTAQIFNRVKYFYSYDPYTMYSIYAALCGCISVVVPEPGLSRGQWYPDDRRLGLAYGADDEVWAAETRPDLLQRLIRERSDEDKLVDQFVEKCAEHFAPGKSD